MSLFNAQAGNPRRTRIRNSKDFAVGALYVGVGALFSIKAYTSYQVGTPQAMGPGFFPFWLGLILIVLGLGVAMQSMAGVRQPLPSISPARLALVLGAIVLFGVLIERIGLPASLFVMVVVASRASHEFTWQRALVCAGAVALFCSLLFVGVLGLQLPLWPRP